MAPRPDRPAPESAILCRMWIRAALLLVLAGPAAAQAPGGRGAAGLAPPCGGDPSADRVAAVSADGEIALASGRTVRLADLRWPEAPAIRAAGLGWLRDRIGAAVAVQAGPPDRWNRRPARIGLATDPPRDPAGGSAPDLASDLARHLVGAGLAVTDPREAERLCDPDLLGPEAAARRHGQGLWARERPLQADAVEDLRRRIGTFAFVEGRVRSVGERERRTYLNFGQAWSEDFTVTVPKRSWAILTAGGLSAATLRGRRIRVRGLLEEWNGPALTLDVPEGLELLDPAPAPR